MPEYPLTKKERHALDCIKRFVKLHGYSPTYEELAELMELETRHHAKYFVYQLKKKKRISIRSGSFKHRKIRLIEATTA